jgi:hypothetical protein
MAWALKKNPNAPVEPVHHDPDRCMGCGHLENQHIEGVGCTVDGGTKYIEESASGEGRLACACTTFLAAPEKEQAHV